MSRHKLAPAIMTFICHNEWNIFTKRC